MRGTGNRVDGKLQLLQRDDTGERFRVIVAKDNRRDLSKAVYANNGLSSCVLRHLSAREFELRRACRRNPQLSQHRAGEECICGPSIDYRFNLS